MRNIVKNLWLILKIEMASIPHILLIFKMDLSFKCKVINNSCVESH
jgi:hypothetical protein